MQMVATFTGKLTAQVSQLGLKVGGAQSAFIKLTKNDNFLDRVVCSAVLKVKYLTAQRLNQA